MTEYSYHWDGTATGDVTLDRYNAPYSSREHSDFWQFILQSYQDVGYVVPEYENELAITQTTPPSLAVEVDTGAVIILGKIYENTGTETISISSNTSAYGRIDTVTLRIDYVEQEIRLLALTGTPSATPVAPTITNTTTIFYYPLAYIYVTAGAVGITNSVIQDVREFVKSFSSDGSFRENNLIANSEFMLLADDTFPTTKAPAHWDIGTPFTISVSSVAKPDFMSRGRAIQFTSTSPNASMGQQLRVLPSTDYAFKYAIKLSTSNTRGRISLTTNSATSESYTHTVYYRGAVWETGYIYFTTNNDASLLNINFSILDANAIIIIGQPLLVQGRVTGPFRQVHEVLFSNSENLAKEYNPPSGTSVTFDYDTDLGGSVLRGTRSVFFTTRFKTTSGTGDELAFKTSGALETIWKVGLPGDTTTGSYRSTNVFTFTHTYYGGVTYDREATIVTTLTTVVYKLQVSGMFI